MAEIGNETELMHESSVVKRDVDSNLLSIVYTLYYFLNIIWSLKETNY